MKKFMIVGINKNGKRVQFNKLGSTPRFTIHKSNGYEVYTDLNKAQEEIRLINYYGFGKSSSVKDIQIVEIAKIEDLDDINIITLQVPSYNLDEIAKTCITAIISKHPNITKREIADKMGISERTLYRYFIKYNF